MSGDSIPLSLPLSRFATDSCEATTLFQELRKPLLRYLSGLGLPPEEAQDVVQEAFLSLHKHLAANGSQTNIRSWLFRVAHNRALNSQLSYSRRMGEPLDPVFDTASSRRHARAGCAGEREDAAVRQRGALSRRAGT